MKKFNINDYIYIQITNSGWEHLYETAGKDYVNSCINREPYRVEINHELWYRLQAHVVFEMLPTTLGHTLYNTNIMIDEKSLT